MKNYTLEEAIDRADMVARSGNEVNHRYHRQIAVWLRELTKWREAIAPGLRENKEEKK